MKVYISADMEGISGITDVEDILPGKRTYEYCRKLFTEDVNAAIEGAIEGGATEIVVNESHGPMRNLIPDELHPKAQLIRGFFKPLLMMQGIDESFDAVFFVGYHGKAGEKDAVLNHTFMGNSFQRFYLNGKESSEADYNAAVAGEFNVPVTFLTGDQQICDDVKAQMPEIETVSVKTGIGIYTAQCLHPQIARENIKNGAKKAMERIQSIKPIKKEDSYSLTIEFKNSNMAEMVSYMPKVELIDARTVRYDTDNLVDGSRVLMAMMLISITAASPLYS